MPLVRWKRGWQLRLTDSGYGAGRTATALSPAPVSADGQVVHVDRYRVPRVLNDAHQRVSSGREGSEHHPLPGHGRPAGSGAGDAQPVVGGGDPEAEHAGGELDPGWADDLAV